MTDTLRDWLTDYFPAEKVESPMEALLFAGWQMMLPRLMLPAAAYLKITPQAHIGKFRADFLFEVRDEAKKLRQLVIEVDGHDFHERTKAQATRDRSRDRWMAEEGYEVMRFTGSEVYANPFKCALEIADRLYRPHYGRSQKEAKAQAGFDAIRALISG